MSTELRRATFPVLGSFFAGGGFMRRLLSVLAVLLSCIAFASLAQAEKRVALVIGNGAYKTVANLPNPARDAIAIGDLLRAAKFDEVTVRTDLGVTDMRAELRQFALRAVGADIAAVFYAGHGVEVGGHNYLVPVDAKLELDTDAEDEAVDLDHILLQLAPVKRLKLVILDACRENPFAPRMRSLRQSREIGRGFVPPSRQGADTLVAYAAAVGETAADGEGIHSPFTSALLNNLTRPGIDIRLALGKVRDEVLSATDSRQIPFITGSLGGDNLLFAVPDAPVTSGSEPDVIQQAFETAMRADTVSALEAFLAQYPQSSFADIGRRERDRLKSAAALVAPSSIVPAPSPIRLPAMPAIKPPAAPHTVSHTPPRETEKPKIDPPEKLKRVLPNRPIAGTAVVPEKHHSGHSGCTKIGIDVFC